MQGDRAPKDGSARPLSVTRHSSSSPTYGAKFTLSTPNSYYRLAIVAGILLPIATVPYLLSRRRISGLQHKYEELEWKLNVLERRLSFSVSETSRVRAEQQKMRATLHDMMQETDVTQQGVMQHLAEQSQTNQTVQSDLQRLLGETKQIRAQFATLRAVGVSLADVAAFMQEMELQMGLKGGTDEDSRGIHRLRLLALQMQSLAEKEAQKGQNP